MFGQFQAQLNKQANQNLLSTIFKKNSLSTIWITNTLDKTSHTHIFTQITLINTNELANLAYTHKPITFSFLVKETLLLPHQEKLFPYMPRNITKLNFEFVTISNTLELTYGV